MIKEYKTKTNIYIGLSILLPIVLSCLFPIVGSPDDGDGDGIIRALKILHFVLFITGCVFYAKAKRQSPAWGALGLLSLLGLIVLICLKDKSKEE